VKKPLDFLLLGYMPVGSATPAVIGYVYCKNTPNPEKGTEDVILVAAKWCWHKFEKGYNLNK
jgi:hypothetical protein